MSTWGCNIVGGPWPATIWHHFVWFHVYIYICYIYISNAEAPEWQITAVVQTVQKEQVAVTRIVTPGGILNHTRSHSLKGNALLHVALALGGGTKQFFLLRTCGGIVWIYSHMYISYDIIIYIYGYYTIRVCMYIQIYMYIYILYQNMYIHMCIYIYTFMYVYMYTYITW